MRYRKSRLYRKSRTYRETVECDLNCGAFVHPETIEEYKAALEHWMGHEVNGGCSHGC